jgi:hypothetical protein
MKINYGIWECPSFGQTQYMQKIDYLLPLWHVLPSKLQGHVEIASHMIPMIGQPHFNDLPRITSKIIQRNAIHLQLG